MNGLHALVCVLLPDNAVAHGRHGRSGHDAQRLSARDVKALPAARAGFAHNGEHGGRLLRGFGDVLAVQRIAVQR